MYSPDIDSLISGIDGTITACIETMKPLAEDCAQQLECGGLETEKPYTMDWGSIQSSVSSIDSGLGEAKSMGESIYSGASGFNTSSGAPWTELQRFKDTADDVTSSPTELKFIGEKLVAISKINTLIMLAVDAKHGVIYYHDILTRGFDSTVHGGEPSITWNKSVTGDKTLGNLENQSDHNNVHIPPESLDPY